MTLHKNGFERMPDLQKRLFEEKILNRARSYILENLRGLTAQELEEKLMACFTKSDNPNFEDRAEETVSNFSEWLIPPEDSERFKDSKEQNLIDALYTILAELMLNRLEKSNVK